ncbi:hypothetical protein LCGC14_1521560 [marine sediment metagenome]|uniref:Uncharacterized protein n=1 Tax=marine sediment metagenome TaxID=412755 RepID=A0A0F9IYQ0_9ZZZZ
MATKTEIENQLNQMIDANPGVACGAAGLVLTPSIDLSKLHPDMKLKLEVYRKVWREYNCDIMENCECLVSGCILDGDTCEDAFDMFNTLGDCKAMMEKTNVA